jgi:hypothetical protein
MAFSNHEHFVCKAIKWGSIPRLDCTQETNTRNVLKLFKVSKFGFKVLNISFPHKRSCGTAVEEKGSVSWVVNPSHSVVFYFHQLLFDTNVLLIYKKQLLVHMLTYSSLRRQQFNYFALSEIRTRALSKQ